MVEGTSGPSKGHVRSRGGLEEELGWLSRLGGSSLRGGGARDIGVSEEVGVGLCAAARTLTRVTSTGAADTFGVGCGAFGFRKAPLAALAASALEAPNGQKWRFG